MKADTSSIIVILLSLLFIFIGGLSKRRKKSPITKSSIQYKRPSDQKPAGKEFLKDAVSMINDPFDKLEKMFNIPGPTYSQEGESLEVEVDKEPRSLEVTDQKAASLEVTDIKATSLEVTDTKFTSLEITNKKPESLEVIVDEVAEYMKEKDKRKSGMTRVKPFDEKDLTWQEGRKVSAPGIKPKTKLSLFKNFDDFKKAVIYSEIMNRKEY
jgi:hypothetical protein